MKLVALGVPQNLRQFIWTMIIDKDEKDILTDAAKIYILKKKKVKLVRGETYNLKITTPYDLKMANAIVKIKGERND